MSEEQLSALLAKLKEDAGLQEKLKVAADLDAAAAMAQEAGFDVSKADLLEAQTSQILRVSDKELEGIAGANQTGGLIYCDETVKGCGFSFEAKCTNGVRYNEHGDTIMC